MNKTICIAGKSELSTYATNYIIDNFKNLDLICLPVESDDGNDDWQPSLKKFAIKNNIKIVSQKDCFKIDNLIFISLQYDKIINPNLFLKSSNFYNIHFSLLPEYRGMYTCSLPLLHGKKYSGVTLHHINNGIDTGNIIDQKKIIIEKINNARELYFLCLKESKIIFQKNIYNIINKKYKSFKQNDNASSYFSKNTIDFSNLSIDLDQKCSNVVNQIRAFFFEEFQIPKVIGYKISYARTTNIKSNLAPGKLVKEENKFIQVSTKDYDILLYKY